MSTFIWHWWYAVIALGIILFGFFVIYKIQKKLIEKEQERLLREVSKLNLHSRNTEKYNLDMYSSRPRSSSSDPAQKSGS